MRFSKSGLNNLEFLIDSVDSVEDNRSMFGYLRKDIPASIVVFLVALPLCLGIALASGAPLASGLIAGIIGGLVIGYISKSGTSVSGPAASVSAVAFAAIASLGNYELFLVAVVISGVFQIILGVLKAGLIADYMPTSIIKGLLAGIGIILIISQLPYAFGLNLPKDGLIDYSSGYLRQSRDMLPQLWNAFSPGALIISIISLATILFWERTPFKNLNWFPASLFVVFMGVLINLIFKIILPDLYLSGPTLVTIPSIENIANFFIFPDFRGFLNLEVWTIAIAITIVASIATLLNIEATDNLDPHKRKTPPNRELIAQGIGNTLSGLVGGLPITSVIVRSSVNIDAGAQTKLSTILHGLLLLVSVLFLSRIINMIPLASLAIVLIVIGYKLASVDVFKKLYKKGWDQFVPFVVTTIGIVFIDLLVGILIGSMVAVYYLLKSNYHNPFFIENYKSVEGELISLELSNEVSFLNKASIKNTLWRIPRNSNLIIDATFSSFIDKDVLEIMEDFQNTFAVEHNINVSIVGLKDEYKSGIEFDFDKVHQNIQTSQVTSPEIALSLLIEGNQRYVQGSFIYKRLRNSKNVYETVNTAFVLAIGCLDLREPFHIILDTDIGEVVPVRTALNLLNKESLNNIEIVCDTQDIKLILFMAHSDNKLMARSLDEYARGQSTELSAILKNSLLPDDPSIDTMDEGEKNEYINTLVQRNVNKSLKYILTHSPLIKKQVEEGNLGVVTGNLERISGLVTFSDMHIPENLPLKIEK